MSTCSINVEYGQFYSFLVNGKRVHLFMDAWDYMDLRTEYAPNSRVTHVEGWAVMDYDDLCAEVDVFQSRAEAELDRYGEDDPREVR